MSTQPITFNANEIQGSQNPSAPITFNANEIEHPKGSTQASSQPNIASDDIISGHLDNVMSNAAKGAVGSATGVVDFIHKHPVISAPFTGGASLLGGIADELSPKLRQAEENVIQQGKDYSNNLVGSTTDKVLGYGGETLLEFLAGDAALSKLPTMAGKLDAIAKITKALEQSPKLMAALKIGIPALRQGAVTGAQKFARSGDIEEALKQGGTVAAIAAAFHVPVEVFQAAIKKSGAEGLTLLSDYMEKSPNSVRPMEKEIAGVKVPVSPTQVQPEKQPFVTKQVLSRVASPDAAQKFIDTQVQPKAIEATNANFSQAAENSIQDARAIRGEVNGPVPRMNTLDDVVNNLQKEAKITYSKLDDAVKPELDEWQNAIDRWNEENPKPEKPATPNKASSVSTQQPTKGGTDVQKMQYKVSLDNWKQAKAEFEADNPKPKTFTELQDQVKSAFKTINSKFSSQVDKEAAITHLPEYQDELQEYVHKYSDMVEPNELEAANKLWSQSSKYDWLSNKIRTATDEGTSSSIVKSVPKKINPNSLKNIPASFDNKFGDGEFEKLIGSQGMKNYNNIREVLQNPIPQGKVDLLNFAVKMTKKPVSWVVDRMLFDPEFGQSTLKAFGKFINSPIKDVAPFIAGKVMSGSSGPLGGRSNE